MKIALVSYEFKNKDIDFNLTQIKKAILESKKQQADLVCFSESFLQGFECLSWNYEIDQDMGVDIHSTTFESIKKLSIEYDIDLCLGYIEKDQDRLYSSYAFIEKGHVKYNYRRISKNWKEYTKTDEHYGEGNSVEPFNYQGVDIQVGLCGDLWIYPSKFKTNHLFIWPVFVGFTLEQWQNEEIEYMKHAYKIADDVLLINSICKDEDCLAHGGAFYFKKGKIEARTSFDKDEILIVDV